MKVIDAEEIAKKYPDRKSLNSVLSNAKPVSITEQIESIKRDMCDNYCKIPYQYSVNEWESIQYSDDNPCCNCPLNKL